jgi:hypothetical protein
MPLYSICPIHMTHFGPLAHAHAHPTSHHMHIPHPITCTSHIPHPTSHHMHIPHLITSTSHITSHITSHHMHMHIPSHPIPHHIAPPPTAAASSHLLCSWLQLTKCLLRVRICVLDVCVARRVCVHPPCVCYKRGYYCLVLSLQRNSGCVGCSRSSISLSEYLLSS